MALYRKKPLVVDAEQYMPGRGETLPGRVIRRTLGGETELPWVRTANGPVGVKEGDWIIAEQDGSGFYPCADAVFRVTYEPA